MTAKSLNIQTPPLIFALGSQIEYQGHQIVSKDA